MKRAFFSAPLAALHPREAGRSGDHTPDITGNARSFDALAEQVGGASGVAELQRREAFGSERRCEALVEAEVAGQGRALGVTEPCLLVLSFVQENLSEVGDRDAEPEGRSDENLKQQIQTIDNALDRLRQI
jgi:hypothetical protein